MTVLHIIDTLDVGGAERLLVGTIQGMPAVNHHVITLADKAKLAGELPVDCKLISLGFKGKWNAISCIRRIRKYIKQNRIDIVHSHLVLSNIMARLATPPDVPLINSMHTINSPRFYRNFFSAARWAEKMTYRKRHTLIAVSQVVLEDYKKHIGLKGKAIVLYNFVEDRFFSVTPRYYTPSGKLQMVAVGSLKPPKNYEFLIAAMRNVQEGVSLSIYGEGPLRDALHHAAANISAIRFLGNEPNIDRILPLYDLFVMSSHYEGHPIALMEAAAAGLPALVPDIPSLKEALNDQGLYFRANDQKDFLNTVEKILNGSIDINKYAIYNWQFAANNARKQQYVERLMVLYKELIRPKGMLPDSSN
ncbi:MAG: glycosyltransferase [Chitinophagaceae bacterium]|nr:glycosyltransferase [Chitinophagaceae bacterium]